MVNPPEKKNLDLCAAQLFASSEVAVSEVEKFLGVTHLAMTHPPNMDNFNDLMWSEILWSQNYDLPDCWVQISQIHQIPSTVGT